MDDTLTDLVRTDLPPPVAPRLPLSGVCRLCAWNGLRANLVLRLVPSGPWWASGVVCRRGWCHLWDRLQPHPWNDLL